MKTHDPPKAPDARGAHPERWERLCRFLHAEAFVVLTHNPANAAGGEYEAWAYQGPLDFDVASPIRFGLGPDPTGAMQALDGQLAEENGVVGTIARKPAPPVSETVLLRVDRRELATILAALRFHQDENLQGGGEIPDKVVADIATDGGTLKPLDFGQVERLCQKLNLESQAAGLNIEPPHWESGEEPLFRVVYVIDVNAANSREAAEHVHQIMTDPESMAPVFQVIDHTGVVVTVDLSGT